MQSIIDLCVIKRGAGGGGGVGWMTSRTPQGQRPGGQKGGGERRAVSNPDLDQLMDLNRVVKIEHFGYEDHK